MTKSTTYTAKDARAVDEVWIGVCAWARNMSGIVDDMRAALPHEIRNCNGDKTAAKLCILSEVHDALLNRNYAMKPSTMHARPYLIRVFTSVSFWWAGNSANRVAKPLYDHLIEDVDNVCMTIIKPVLDMRSERLKQLVEGN